MLQGEVPTLVGLSDGHVEDVINAGPTTYLCGWAQARG
jgi:hypothetical protein